SRSIEQNETRFEAHYTDDADYLIVAFGSVARICLKAIEDLRAEGLKVGLIRPVTLWPFPTDAIAALCNRVKGILTVELNAGQMIQDVRLAADGKVPVWHYGRMGGNVPNPSEITNALKSNINKLPE
ncbi:MAG: 3-methyl-2-oxobutanoate dehydrogenase subunit beta, partial [Muribaculaceae bacterium]|nr:3-methyl-2-oxobutanoate dehydrogenase subunit beta [Muribaculaceae bacterium]